MQNRCNLSCSIKADDGEGNVSQIDSSHKLLVKIRAYIRVTITGTSCKFTHSKMKAMGDLNCPQSPRPALSQISIQT